MGEAHRRHMCHHQELYPVRSYQSETYRDPGKNSTVLTFVWASIPMVGAPILFAASGWIGWITMAIVVAEMLLFGWLSDLIHDQFHLLRSPLNRFAAFRRWNELHYQHHLGDMQTNFGIFDYGFDKLFGTYHQGVAIPTDKEHI